MLFQKSKCVYQFIPQEAQYPTHIVFNTGYEIAPDFKDIFGVLQPGLNICLISKFL
jgi:hypothetical protein